MTTFEDEKRSLDDLVRLRTLAQDRQNEDERRATNLNPREQRFRDAAIELEKRVEALEREKLQLQKDVRWHKAKRVEGEDIRRDLKKRLADSQLELKKSKQEEIRLRADLRRVRGSRSYRLGNTLLEPGRVVRRAFTNQDGARSTQTMASEETAQKPIAAAQSATTTQAPVAAQPLVKPAQAPSTSASKQTMSDVRTSQPARPNYKEWSVDQLREDFAENPSPGTFVRLLHREWYQLGNLSECVKLVNENQEYVDQLSQRDALVIPLIFGIERLKNIQEAIPPRTASAAFNPERNRLMYCVHSTPAFNSNGYSTRTRGVAAGIRSAGMDLTVVARAGYPWDTPVDRERPLQERSVIEIDGIDYIHIPGSSWGRQPLDRYVIEAADAFVREGLVQRPAVIQAASNHVTGLSALIAARRLGVPFVYEVRGFWELSQAAAKPDWAGSEHFQTLEDMETLVASEADHVFAITRQVRESLIERGIDADKISVVPNGVNTDVFLPLPRDEEYAKAKGIRTDVPVIGFAGSMVPYEGLDLLIEASGLLAQRGVAHQVVFAGSGNQEDALRKAGQSAGNRIKFLGRLPIDEMPRLLSTFDIMPIPRRSLAVTEMVSPLKPLEAFSAMKAVVMSDVAPHRDLAGEFQERALLFTADDSGELASALEQLIVDDDLRHIIGRQARLWTLDERRWNIIGTTMVSQHAALAAAQSADRRSNHQIHRRARIGLIADEFTTKTLAPSTDLVILDRQNWATQLEAENLDFVFIESAWRGNSGQWHRGVGRYEDEEFKDISALLCECRSRGIPSVFWNKEDPVHFERFKATAALCDHILTTDANLIPDYLGLPGAVTKTVSSLPFYAQPKIHNPLPTTREFTSTVAYAGTYYGDRYKDRSQVLRTLLEASKPYGLTIFDRQADNPDSPYQFPEGLREYSRGAIPYDEVLASYKSHLAHINVNSVTESPTMFSRRVVEIAASGGVVLSGPGRGINEVFSGLIPVAENSEEVDLYLRAWTASGEERLREAWRQLRAIHRSHTIDSALKIIGQTLGLDFAPATVQFRYGLIVDNLDQPAAQEILKQSVVPLSVFAHSIDEDGRTLLEKYGIAVVEHSSFDPVGLDWMGRFSLGLPRTWFEDLLSSSRYGHWPAIAATTADDQGPLTQLVRFGISGGIRPEIVSVTTGDDLDAIGHRLDQQSEAGISLLMPPLSGQREYTEPVETYVQSSFAQTVLVAGHDLKFMQPLLEALEKNGNRVLIDQWHGHSGHDETKSLQLLEEADVIWCEWGLGNLEWYSKNVRPHQRLLCRIHLQEIFRPYMRRANHACVDQYIFIGELIRQAAVISHGVPEEKTVVIPNMVAVEDLELPKVDGAEHNLGLVGIVPERKRLDLAVDVLERLLKTDSTYRLFIKGKRPEEYEWMANRPEEMEYYEEVYSRIDRLNARFPDAVTFDPHGSDMAQWYRKIGIALSVSDFESFHYTIADGAASGATPVSFAWAGSDLLYPREWLVSSAEQMANQILAGRKRDSGQDAAVIRELYGQDVVIQRLMRAIQGLA